MTTPRVLLDRHREGPGNDMADLKGKTALITASPSRFLSEDLAHTVRVRATPLGERAMQLNRRDESSTPVRKEHQ
jgi:hypothetical protein